MPSCTSQPIFSSATICSSEFTPPAATTRHFTASRSFWHIAMSVPCIQPSFSTQVNSSSLAYFSASRAPSMSGMFAVSVQPFTAMLPLIASTEMITRCLPIAASSSSRNAVFKIDSPSFRDVFHAADPMMTFSAPREISSRAFFTSRMPPPTRTLPFLSKDFKSAVLAVLPFSSVWRSAASRSMMATSPYLLKSAMRLSASSRCSIKSLPFLS